MVKEISTKEHLVYHQFGPLVCQSFFKRHLKRAHMLETILYLASEECTYLWVCMKQLVIQIKNSNLIFILVYQLASVLLYVIVCILITFNSSSRLIIFFSPFWQRSLLLSISSSWNKGIEGGKTSLNGHIDFFCSEENFNLHTSTKMAIRWIV